MQSLGERCRLYLCFVTGLFECLGFTGVIFGWPSLVFVLKEEKYFLDACDTLHNISSGGARNGSTPISPRSVGCDLQDDRFTLVFTIAAFSFSFFAFPSGVLFDFLGTMVTRILAIIFYTAAALMIALSTAASAMLLFPALTLMAIGGSILFITNMQVANLFTNRRSTIITLYNGALDSSSAVFLLVKVLHEAGFSLMSMFLFITSLSTIHILRTFFLLPRTHIPYPLPERYTFGKILSETAYNVQDPASTTVSVREFQRLTTMTILDQILIFVKLLSRIRKQVAICKILSKGYFNPGVTVLTNRVSCNTLALPSFSLEESTPGQVEPDHGTEGNMGEKDGTHDKIEGDIGHGHGKMEADGGERKAEKEGGPGERQEHTEGGNGEMQEEMGMIGTVTPNESEGSAGPEEQIPTFRSCIFSKIFLTQLFWLAVIQLQMALFIGTLNPMLTQATDGDSLQVSRFTNAFAFTQFFGIFIAPWNGLILDRHRRRTVSSDSFTATASSQKLADMESAVLSLAITVTLGILFSIFAAIPVLQVQYLTFALQVITRSFLFGGASAFITIAFPACYFGKILGLTFALSACVTLLQYPCLALIQGPLQNHPLYLKIGFIVLVTLTYAHPIHVYLHCRREMGKRGVANPSQVEVSDLEE